MKHLKIKLSVLALACLGAGAFALQPANYAKAEGETTFGTSGIVMQEGAAVSLGAGFSGIRWATTVKADWYTKVTAAWSEAKVSSPRFGVVVAPTGSFEGELTVETAGAMELTAEGKNYFKGNKEKDTTYYSVVSYDKLWENYEAGEGTMTQEEVMQAAYSMELTARAYVRYRIPVEGGEEGEPESQAEGETDGETGGETGGETTVTYKVVYEYADMVDSSRSARQVALAAELAGELDGYRESTSASEQAKAQKAAGYYGYGANAEDYYKDYVVSNGAAGTAVIDLSAVATADQNVGVALTIAEGYTVDEVMVGSKKVVATYTEETTTDEETQVTTTNGTLTLNLKAGQALPTGETYVKVFAKNADSDVVVYTKPIIGATMVFDSFDDFDVFAKIRENLDNLDENGKSTEDSKISFEMQGDHVASDYEFDGYYVLADSLTYEGDALVDADANMGRGWRSCKNFGETKLGLTGTFNGLGHTITGFADKRKNSGLFQLVNGGTIKNLAMVDFAPKQATAYHLAHYAINPKLENVYITNSSIPYSKGPHILSNYLAQTKEGGAKFTNVYINSMYASYATKQDYSKAGWFANLAITAGSIDWSNVYAVSNVGVYYKNRVQAYADFNDKANSMHVADLVYGDNQKTAGKISDPGYSSLYYVIGEKGYESCHYLYKKVEYPVYTAKDANTGALTVPTPSLVYFEGLNMYYKADDFKAAGHDFSAFTGATGAGCWSVVDGALTWGK